MMRLTVPKLIPFLVLLLFGCVAAHAQDKDPLVKVWSEIFAKRWENAARELAKVEKGGGCKVAVCLATHAIISNGAGAGPEAVEYARQALAAGQNSGLKANQYNDLGALLYRRAEGKRELLQLAETTLRHADSIYTGGASNIRFNLAKVLQKLGHKDQAQKIMKALEADGLLIDPGMAILGDFQRPEPPISRTIGNPAS
jgi:hypothetical protein